MKKIFLITLLLLSSLLTSANEIKWVTLKVEIENLTDKEFTSGVLYTSTTSAKFNMVKEKDINSEDPIEIKVMNVGKHTFEFVSNDFESIVIYSKKLKKDDVVKIRLLKVNTLKGNVYEGLELVTVPVTIINETTQEFKTATLEIKTTISQGKTILKEIEINSINDFNIEIPKKGNTSFRLKTHELEDTSIFSFHSTNFRRKDSYIKFVIRNLSDVLEETKKRKVEKEKKNKK